MVLHLCWVQLCGNEPYYPSENHSISYAILNATSLDLGFERNPTTLAQQLTEQRWPVRHCAKAFTTNCNLLELCLTEKNEFQHELTKCYEDGNVKKKRHCALCCVRKTLFWCSTCQVSLCRVVTKSESPNVANCFVLWHNIPDLVNEQKKLTNLVTKNK